MREQVQAIVDGKLAARDERVRLGIGSYTYTWAVGVPGHPPAGR